MKLRAVALVLLAVSAAGCSVDGSSEPVTSTVAAPTTPATTATTTTAPALMAVTIYRVADGVMRPHVVHVPRTEAVATAALHELVPGATVTIADGTAKVTAATIGDVSNVDTAEVVWTLTQFPTVERVDVNGSKGLTRGDFGSYVPPIAVETPTPGQSVPAEFRVAGSASVFEATLVVQTLRDGKVLSKQTVTASEGAPARGTFAATVHATPGPLTVQVFSPSAADGAPQHEVDVDVTVTP